MARTESKQRIGQPSSYEQDVGAPHFIAEAGRTGIIGNWRFDI